MLKSVVQYVNRCTQPPFGHDAGEVAFLRHTQNRPWDGSRHHERLIARPREIGEHPFTIRDDDDSVGRICTFIATAEDCRTLTLGQEPRRNRHRQWCLPRAANAQVADTDDRTEQAAACLGVAFKPATS